MTTETLPLLRWSPQEFAEAFEKGVFEGHGRVQLVDGMVWEMAGMGSWHGQTVMRLAGLLAETRAVVTAQTLPMPGSLPDPDVWVLREGAVPTGHVGTFETWDPADVLLVVEVADTTRAADLGVKATIYARGGVENYWVVTKAGITVQSGARGGDGYQNEQWYRPGDAVVVPYGESRTLDVIKIIG